VEIDLHFVRERVALGVVHVLHVPRHPSSSMSSPRVFHPLSSWISVPLTF
jgi:hypothetical protein